MNEERPLDVTTASAGSGTENADELNHDAASETASEATSSRDAGAFETIDVERLNKAVNLTFNPEAVNLRPVESEGSGSDDGERLEDIAEDMLILMRRVKNLEAGLEQIQHVTRDGFRLQAREIDLLRRDLLGERKAKSALAVFNAIVPTLDSLRAMLAKLNHAKDARMRAQLDGVIQAISMAVRGLGFTEFQVEKGLLFDPSRMECLGFAKGEPGTVLGLIRPGYLADEMVIRPAGVLIANPADKESMEDRS